MLAFEERIIEASKSVETPKQHSVIDWSKSFVYCMGNNKNGCLGLGYASTNESESEEEDSGDETENKPQKHKNFDGNFRPSLGDLAGKLIRQVACGGNFTLALSEEGEVFAWGKGSSGALGTGSYQDEVAPKKIMLDQIRSEAGLHLVEEKARYIAAGERHSLAVSQSGKLYAWGNNDFGQLGIVTKGTKKAPSSNTPQRLTSLKHPMDKVACGASHSAAISNEDRLFTWGANKNGQLGFTDFANRFVPEQVTELKEESIRWVACGSNHTLVLTRAGEMYGFGNNTFNKLGCRDYKLHINKNLPPTKISLVPEDEEESTKSEEAIMQVETSSNCSIALTSDGRIFTWGNNEKGCLGREVRNEANKSLKEVDEELDDDEEDEEEEDNDDELYLSAYCPYPVTEGINSFKTFSAHRNLQTLSTKFTDVQCGLDHTVALTDAGELWVWGSNASGQHGLSDQAINIAFEKCRIVKELGYRGELSWTAYPTRVPKFNVKSNRRITLLCTGTEHILAVENNKKLYAWGKNSEGQLGLGRICPSVTEPESIKKFTGVPISCMAASESHSLVVTKEGELYGFGSNKNGLLGLGSIASSHPSPKRVLFQEDVKIEKVACAPSYSLALDNKKSIYSWGDGLDGQLGHGDLEILYKPQKIDAHIKFIEISAGKTHAAAVSEDKRIYIWGLKEAFLIYKDALDNEEELTGPKEKYILTPLLWDQFVSKKVVKVWLGNTFNALITESKTLYTWGEFENAMNYKLGQLSRQLYNKRYQLLSEGEKYKVRKQLQRKINRISNIKSCLNVSHNANHICVQTAEDDLYTWGIDDFTGRLGLAFDEFFEIAHSKKLKASENQEYKSTVLDTQEKVKWFTTKFIANKKELQKTRGFEEAKTEEIISKKASSKKDESRVIPSTGRRSIGMRSSIGRRRGSIEYKRVQSHEDEVDEDRSEFDIKAIEKFLSDLRFEEKIQLDAKLSHLDQNLKQESANVLKKFAELRDLEHSIGDFYSLLESEVFKRIAQPPFGKTTIKKKVSDLPEAYTLNKEVYKKLLTVLQMHPCYLIKMYDPTNIDALFEIIKDVYGDIEMDRRKTNMFIILSLKILKLELSKLDPKIAKLSFGNSEDSEDERSTPLFIKLFNHFVQSQGKNIAYLRKITERIGNMITESFQSEKYERNKFAYFLYLSPNKEGYMEFMERYKNESEEGRKIIIRENAKNMVKRKFGSELFNLMNLPSKNFSIGVKYLIYRTIKTIAKKFKDIVSTKIIKNRVLGKASSLVIGSLCYTQDSPSSTFSVLKIMRS